MGTLFTILVVALAFFSIVAMMVIVMREKVDHDAHTRYVRSPWNDDAETPRHTDAQVQQGALNPGNNVPLADPDAPAAGDETADEPQA